ncbi:hypothetical protein [Colwellia sp. E2M01]|uniref:hypothetical protein n=1 Tax=Colwellia sp. E2M01 TaxID=2841561 RepID=UPI001C0836A3|nr:hypothetical protein [Colwellia sp. E2M01]MBU2871303.1 hypothetical protein [Colwellia sp. E2M01]
MINALLTIIKRNNSYTFDSAAAIEGEVFNGLNLEGSMEIKSNNQINFAYQNKPTTTEQNEMNVLISTTRNSDTVTISNAALQAENQLHNIASKYDPTNMSYHELNEMSSELQSSGLITAQEGLAMRAPPSIEFNPNEKYDALSSARKSVDFDRSYGATNQKDAQLRASVLDIFERLQGLSNIENNV